MKFIALKTENGAINGQISFYCRVLNVSTQGFYKYLRNRDKPWKYAALAAVINKIIEEDECNDTYGSERMHMALKLKESQAESRFPDVPSERTVYRIMRKMGVIHKPNRNPKGITKADKKAQKSDNLIKNTEIIDGKKQSDFLTERPCEKCVGDITEVACMDGKLYVSALEDCFNNEILGLSMAEHMRAELVRDTLKMAVRLHPDLVRNKAIAHTDRGSQYTSDLYRRYLKKYGIRQSMNSAAGRCHDNAKAESLWGRMKEELLYDRYDTEKMTVNEVKSLIWRYFMSYWNNRRICSANGGLPPAVKRRLYYGSILTNQNAA